MNQKQLFFILIIGLAALNVATIRREEDPIRKTQTDPIAYQQKLEEEKGGKKGPLAYSMKYNPSDAFLTATPVASSQNEEPSAAGFKKEEMSPTSWWEEVPAEGKEPVAEDTETTSGSLFAEEPAGNQTQAVDFSPSSAEDFWW